MRALALSALLLAGCSAAGDSTLDGLRGAAAALPQAGGGLTLVRGPHCRFEGPAAIPSCAYSDGGRGSPVLSLSSDDPVVVQAEQVAAAARALGVAARAETLTSSRGTWVDLGAGAWWITDGDAVPVSSSGLPDEVHLLRDPCGAQRRLIWSDGEAGVVLDDRPRARRFGRVDASALGGAWGSAASTFEPSDGPSLVLAGSVGPTSLSTRCRSDLARFPDLVIPSLRLQAEDDPVLELDPQIRSAELTEALERLGRWLGDPRQATVFFGASTNLVVLRGERTWRGRLGTELSAGPAPRRAVGPSPSGVRFDGPRGWFLLDDGEDLWLRHQADDAGLIDAAEIVPGLRVDLAYTRASQLFDQPVYPIDARCLLTRPSAEALGVAQGSLALQGLQLVVWDCYRPLPVQARMWAVLPDPRFVARPTGAGSSHNRGAAVDVGVVGLDGETVPLPTPHDAFVPKAARDAGPKDGLFPLQIENRDALRKAMEAAGFTGISAEWWHYAGLDAEGRPALSVPFPGLSPGEAEEGDRWQGR